MRQSVLPVLTCCGGLLRTHSQMAGCKTFASQRMGPRTMCSAHLLRRAPVHALRNGGLLNVRWPNNASVCSSDRCSPAAVGSCTCTTVHALTNGGLENVRWLNNASVCSFGDQCSPAVAGSCTRTHKWWVGKRSLAKQCIGLLLRGPVLPCCGGLLHTHSQMVGWKAFAG